MEILTKLKKSLFGKRIVFIHYLKELIEKVNDDKEYSYITIVFGDELFVYWPDYSAEFFDDFVRLENKCRCHCVPYEKIDYITINYKKEEE